MLGFDVDDAIIPTSLIYGT